MTSSIAQLFKNKPVKHDRLIPLDFSKTKALPDSHVWSPPPLLPESATSPVPVPVLNLTHPERPAHLRVVCEEWGVFQITDHGVSDRLLQNVEYQTRRLFTLPMQRKILAVRALDESTGYGLARISMLFDKLMWSEGFSIMGSSLRHARLLWPDDHLEFCNVMEEYQRVLEDLSHRLIRMLMGSLGLTHEDIDWAVQNKTGSSPGFQSFLQLNSYPVCPEPDLAMGLAPHTDSSLFTILYQSNIAGLQIQRPREYPAWTTVEPIPGALVVIIGDMFHMLSNGRFKNRLHRVFVNRTHHRFSTAYFCGPLSNVVIEPLPKLIDEDHPPMYRSVIWSEYLEAKATHFDKAMALFRN